jgi:hypothetical protein
MGIVVMRCHVQRFCCCSALQAAWHPSSPSHFAALASDNRWRLYHTSKLILAPISVPTLLSALPTLAIKSMGRFYK